MLKIRKQTFIVYLKEEMFLPLCQWGLLVVKCWNSNITTGVNYSNLYLSFINFKQT